MALRLSSPDESWNRTTWVAFGLLFVVYGYTLVAVTGALKGWLNMLRLCFGAVGDAQKFDDGIGGMGDRVSIGVFIFANVVFIIPIILALIPTLGTLLVAMKLTNRSKESQEDW
jgi:hypothetical protein